MIDEPTQEEHTKAQELLDGLEKIGNAIQPQLVASACSELYKILLPSGLKANPERLQAFAIYAEQLRAWQSRHGYREEARRCYMVMMKARRHWLWRLGLAEGRLGMAMRSWLYFLAEIFTGYGEGLGRWFFSSMIMVYLFGFLFVLVDYLQVLTSSMPVFDVGGSKIAGMYFYLSTITFLGVGFRTLQFDDFLGVFLIDLEFWVGKLMLLGLAVILIRKFLKQNSY